MGKTRRRAPNGAEFLTTRLCSAYENGELSPCSSQPLPPLLPTAFGDVRGYYMAMQQLIIDEAFAMVADGLTSAHGRAPLRLSLDEALRATESRDRSSSSLGYLCFTQQQQHGSRAWAAEDRMRAGGVFLVASHGTELLGVVDGRANLQLEVLDEALARCPARALQAGAAWTATPVGSVLVQQRCTDVSLKRPMLPFMRQLLGGPPPKLATHIRFDEQEEEEEEAGGEAATEVAEAEEETANGDAHDDTEDVDDDASAAASARAMLNECQQGVVTRLCSESKPDSLALLQGPLGTGKTTTLVAYLTALRAARGTGRILVCAPSNRGVQEVCDRFLEVSGRSRERRGGAGGGASPRKAPHVFEDEVLLIGDVDKVPSDAPCGRVFLYTLADRWCTSRRWRRGCRIGTLAPCLRHRQRRLPHQRRWRLQRPQQPRRRVRRRVRPSVRWPIAHASCASHTRKRVRRCAPDCWPWPEGALGSSRRSPPPFALATRTAGACTACAPPSMSRQRRSRRRRQRSTTRSTAGRAACGASPTSWQRSWRRQGAR